MKGNASSLHPLLDSAPLTALSVLPPAPSLGLPYPSSPELGAVPIPCQRPLSFQRGLTTVGGTPALLFPLPRNPACCSTV